MNLISAFKDFNYVQEHTLCEIWNVEWLVVVIVVNCV